MDLDEAYDLDDIDLPPTDEGDPPSGGPPRRPPPAAVLPWLALLFGVLALRQLAMALLPALSPPYGAWGTLLFVLALVGGGFGLAAWFARAHDADRRRGARR